MSISEIFDAIVASRDKRSPGILATVDSVDVANKYCEVTTLDGATIRQVRLLPQTASGVLFIQPKQNSFVIIHQISDNDYYVAMFSQIDEIDLGGTTYGGLVEVANLITKMNNLENKVNSMITTFNAHVHGGVTSGVALSAISTSLVAGSLTPTVQSDLENTVIKHGNGIV